MRQTLLLGFAALVAAADALSDTDWECPKHCHCLPDPARPAHYKLSCTRPGLWGPESLLDVQAARVTSFRQTCPHSSTRSSRLETDTFAGFSSLRHLTLRHCRLNQSALPQGLLRPVLGLLSLRLEHLQPVGHDSVLEMESGFFGPLEKTELISLSGIRLGRLPGGAFCHLQELKLLNLSNSGLKNMAATGFPGAQDCRTSIVILDLSRNSLQTMLPGDFANFPLLRVLHLEHNGLRTLPGGLFPPDSALQSLLLSDNDLRSIEELVPTVTELDLSGNSLPIVPAAVASSVRLRSLNLSSNALDDSSPFPLALPSLTTLDLSHNAFSRLPPSFFTNASSLSDLLLAGNALRVLGEGELEGLGSLRRLDLSSNSLAQLTAEALGGLGSLETLVLRNNSLSSLDGEALQVLENLQHLDLANNVILDVPTDLTKLYHLMELDLSRNQISSVTKFLLDKLPNLRRLSLAANRLRGVERYTFEDISSLQYLDLSNNRIEALEPLSFSRNPNLRSLRLDQNLISAMDDAFQSLPALVELNLTQNAITFMDYGMLPGTLQRLSLRRNRLTALTNVQSPPPRLDLAHVDLSFNNLTFLSNYSVPSSLVTLNVSHNRIAAVEPRTLRGKARLAWLDLRSNALTDLPRQGLRVEEGDLESGAELWLAGNPLDCSCELDWLKARMERAQGVRMPPAADYPQLECRLAASDTVARLQDLRRSQLLCPYHQICSADCLCCDFDACDCKNSCPDGCNCFRDSSYLENIVHCSGAQSPPVQPRVIPMYATQIHLDGGLMPHIPSHAFLGRFKLRHLYLNGSGLRQIDARAFHGLSSLELLDLSNNELTEVRGDELSKLDKLRHLFLHGNAIHALGPGALDALPALESLTLHDNAFQRLPPALLLHPITTLTLAGNPFLCDCGEPFALQTWLPTHTATVRDADAVHCAQDIRPPPTPDNRSLLHHTSTILRRFPPDEDGIIKVNFWTLRKELNRTLCGGAMISMDASDPESLLLGLPVNYVIIAGVFLLLLVLGSCLFVVFAALYARRKSDKVPGATMLKNRKGPGSLNSSGTATTPVPLISSDAFVSYSSADAVWVVEELAGRLEGESPYLQLCLLHRDLPTPVAAFHQYHLVNDDIALAMRRSSALLVVLSRSFLAGEWETTQVKVAHLCHLKEKTSKLIFIVLGDVRLDSVDPVLGQHLRHSTLLHAAHPLFWDQLRDALPSRTHPHSLHSDDADPEYSHLYYGPIVPSGFL